MPWFVAIGARSEQQRFWVVGHAPYATEEDARLAADTAERQLGPLVAADEATVRRAVAVVGAEDVRAAARLLTERWTMR